MKLNYFVFGTNRMDAAVAFYDELFSETSINKIVAGDRMVFWEGEGTTFAVAKPFDEEQATAGNGTMAGFQLETPEEIQRWHAKVLQLGGSCDGKPGDRGPMYAAYARDLDGNKIAFYAMNR